MGKLDFPEQILDMIYQGDIGQAVNYKVLRDCFTVQRLQEEIRKVKPTKPGEFYNAEIFRIIDKNESEINEILMKYGLQIEKTVK